MLAGTDGRYHPARRLIEAVACRAPEGDCLADLRALDDRERASRADESDLATREVVEPKFPRVDGPAGVLVAARQTLLSTFLFYQTMAFAGRRAGDLLAALERGGPEVAQRAIGMARVLGGIEVEVSGGGGPWTAIGSFGEAGPIAGDVRVLPFPAARRGPVRVRLRLAKGHWRLGAVALARLDPPVEATGVNPERALPPPP